MYDAVIVGASMAGCSAAMQLARLGWKVAVLERSSQPEHHKKQCTHFIQSSAIRPLEQLGLVSDMEKLGGVRTQTRLCTPWGWIDEPTTEPATRGINLQRRLLDPLLPRRTQAESGIDFHSGVNVDRILVDRHGRVKGVAARLRGQTCNYTTNLTIAADGRNSSIAKLAGIPTQQTANDRFSYFAYYDGSLLRAGGNANFWHLDSRLAFADENGDGTSLLGIFLPASEHDRFRSNPAVNFRNFWRSIPEAPAIESAQPISKLRGYVKFPNQSRPAAIPGLALIGDATMSVDPMWAAGLAFAVLSSDRLVRSLSSTCGDSHGRSAQRIDRGLRLYQRSQRLDTRQHIRQIASFSRLRKATVFEQFIFSAAVRDPRIAKNIFAMIQRNANPIALAAPRNLWRATQVHLKRILQPCVPNPAIR